MSTPAPPAILKRVPLFAELSAEELSGLAENLRRRRYPKGATIFLQGDPGSDLCLVESGQVKIVLTSTEGREFILALLRPGDFFGELALLDGEPRSADAVAQEPCQLLQLARADFTRFIEARPSVAIRLLGLLSRRLRHDSQIVQDVASLDVPTRIARALQGLAESHGRAEADGVLIASRLTQSELAQMIGATRESVNKWLGTFERQGWIGRREGRIVIRDPARLRAAAEGQAADR